MPEVIEFTLKRRGQTTDPAAGLEEWARKLNAGLAVSGQNMPAIMKEHLQEVTRRLIAKHGMKYPNTTADTLSVRSGTLLADLQNGVRVMGTTLRDTQGGIAQGSYLKLHEYGGTLTPHNAKYLAIPLSAALNSDGTPIKDSPRDWSNTFVQRSRAGNLLIFRRQGAGIVPLYALKSSVTIPARLGAREMVRDRMPYLTSRVLDAVLHNLVL